jgi:uncharacterized membrane protein (DUF106 family)
MREKTIKTDGRKLLLDALKLFGIIITIIIMIIVVIKVLIYNNYTVMTADSKPILFFLLLSTKRFRNILFLILTSERFIYMICATNLGNFSGL